MKKFLTLEDVTVSYHRIPAVHHVSAKLPFGSCTGILGPNGAGKTTLLKAIAGLLPLETGTIKLSERRDSDLRSLAYVPQRESVDWDFPITVRGLVEMGCYPALGWWRPFGKKDRENVEEALRIMDLTDLADRQIKALSGGQQQRAFLARSWAQQSEIYLLDEPFAGLDRNAQASFQKCLELLRAKGCLVLASHHDLEEAREFFDHALLLNGELISSGPSAEALGEEHLERAYGTKIFSGPPPP
jgi:ABC-type Mn2+/Zn2+ transport system ATPase subunit